jgi:hypothetical protein
MAELGKSTAVQADMRDRWLPGPEDVKNAQALLDCKPDDHVVVLGMVQPGKDHGVWVLGQEVETVTGIYLLARTRGTPPDGARSYGWARNQASELARKQLGDRPGTTGYAVVATDGTVVVFED